MSQVFVDSLRNRVRAMNILWERALSDLTLEQMNHHERAGVLPMAFSFSHYMQTQDRSISVMFNRELPLWSSGNYAEKIGVSVDAFGREETVEMMEELTFKDLDAYREYQAKVIERTDAVLDILTEDLLMDVLMPALPPNMQQIFCAIVIGPNAPLRKLEVMECFIYQHGLRHMGEIEHGRALVGLGGMTS